MQELEERTILDAIESVASLAVLEQLCVRTNSSLTARVLAERCHREVAEVEQALETFRRAGVVRTEVAEAGETLYALSPAASVWRFAHAFSRHFGTDARFSRGVIDALVRNTGRKAGVRQAFAA